MMTQHQYDTYGLSGVALRNAVPLLADALRVELRARDSDYYGGVYYKYSLNTASSIMLFANYDARRAEWIRPRYREHELLLVLSDLAEMNLLGQRLRLAYPAIVLLESKVIESDENEDE